MNHFHYIIHLTEYSVVQFGGMSRLLCQTHFVVFVNYSTQFQWTVDVAMNAKCGFTFISGQMCMGMSVPNDFKHQLLGFQNACGVDENENILHQANIMLIILWPVASLNVETNVCQHRSLNSVQQMTACSQINVNHNATNKNVASNKKYRPLFALNDLWKKKLEWLATEKKIHCEMHRMKLFFSGGKFEWFSEIIILHEVT